MSSNQSLLSQFDELWKVNTVCNQPHLEEFLRFTISQEDCRVKWLESVRELQKLKHLYDEAKKDINRIEMKLNTARKYLDKERKEKLRSEEERLKIEGQLHLVRDLLTDNRNKIHDETKEKLKFLNSTVRSRLSNDYNERLGAIQELDSTGSLLSDFSLSMSDNDLDMDLRRKRTYKKQRPSVAYDDVASAKRRRSTNFVEVNNRDGVTERMVATTTVTMEHDGSMSAQSQIETIPSAMPSSAPAPARSGSTESLESGLSIENNNIYNQGNTGNVGVLPIGQNKINLRNHIFASKTMIRPEECDVCEKRIKFGNTVLRCQNCKAACHPMCKESLPNPCVAPGNTPLSKKNVGVLADYVPDTPPLVPALVVHCVGEIEARGLNEHGIYRLSGSDKDIKALKERFMKCRGAPRLGHIDIHTISSCLKEFLRTLKEPLVTDALWWEFVRAAEVHDVEERRARLYQAISQLPHPNRDTLAYIILHLFRVAECKEANSMPVSNLATIFAPTIVGYPSDSAMSDTYTFTVKAKLVMDQFLAIPADYWFRVMSSSGPSTPRITQALSAQRTPSSRSYKNLFHTPMNK